MVDKATVNPLKMKQAIAKLGDEIEKEGVDPEEGARRDYENFKQRVNELEKEVEAKN